MKTKRMSYRDRRRFQADNEGFAAAAHGAERWECPYAGHLGAYWRHGWDNCAAGHGYLRNDEVRTDNPIP